MPECSSQVEEHLEEAKVEVTEEVEEVSGEDMGIGEVALAVVEVGIEEVDQ